jgi:hypothetical protein
MLGARDGKAYRVLPTCIVFCTLRVILKGPARRPMWTGAAEKRTAVSSDAFLFHAVRDPEGAGLPADMDERGGRAR